MAYLDNKVGIVTGGGTGIGRATALAMARAGASLVIGNRSAKLGEAVVRAIEQCGGRAVFQVTDVSKPADVTLALTASRYRSTSRTSTKRRCSSTSTSRASSTA